MSAIAINYLNFLSTSFRIEELTKNSGDFTLGFCCAFSGCWEDYLVFQSMGELLFPVESALGGAVCSNHRLKSMVCLVRVVTCPNIYTSFSGGLASCLHPPKALHIWCLHPSGSLVQKVGCLKFAHGWAWSSRQPFVATLSYGG